MPTFDHEATREALGEIVRIEWVKCARALGDTKPAHLVEWADLNEQDKEIDRRIGTAVWSAILNSFAPEIKALILHMETPFSLPVHVDSD